MSHLLGRWALGFRQTQPGLQVAHSLLRRWTRTDNPRQKVLAQRPPQGPRNVCVTPPTLKMAVLRLDLNNE